MELLQYTLRKLLSGIPLVLGVTFISFLLMVYFGPDKTYELLGKNPTEEQIAEVRKELGYDQPFTVRYGNYLREIVTLLRRYLHDCAFASGPVRLQDDAAQLSAFFELEVQPDYAIVVALV